MHPVEHHAELVEPEQLGQGGHADRNRQVDVELIPGQELMRDTGRYLFFFAEEGEGVDS